MSLAITDKNDFSDKGSPSGTFPRLQPGLSL